MNESVFHYLLQLNMDSIQDQTLDEWSAQSQSQKIPVLRPQSSRLLYLLLKLHQPKVILEIGTGAGVSTLWMSKACPHSQIISLERDKNRFLAAQQTFSAFPLIRVINQDVFHYLEQSKQQFDCIFMDSQKRDYIDLLPLLEAHCYPHCLLITDNILFGGKVAQESLEDERKYRSGVERLKQFNTLLSRSAHWESISLPLEDGVTISLFGGTS